jgi:hypothetical protein
VSAAWPLPYDIVAELVFVLADFPSPQDPDGHDGDALAGSVDAAAGRPRLPLLETLLARAQVAPLVPDWRAWLATRTAATVAVPATPAATVAAAWDLAGAAGRAYGQVWLATPVHYFAGLDSVHLHPAGLLRLDRAEQQRLVADFERVFADSPWKLTALDRRELLLWGPAAAASGADPALFAGSDPSAGLPRGEGAAALRGLGAEIEMWLYEHPLNLERRERGELPVTTLWLWGAMRHSGATSGTTSRPAHLLGQDTYAEALWRLQGKGLQALPESLDAVRLDTEADLIVLYPVLQPEGLSSALQAFEQRWLPGAWRALRWRRVSRLTLLVGARCYRLGWPQLARIWRARQPWWETLA